MSCEDQFTVIKGKGTTLLSKSTADKLNVLCVGYVIIYKGRQQNSLAASPMQLAASNLYKKSYTSLLNAVAFWLQQVAMNFDVFPKAGSIFNHLRGN